MERLAEICPRKEVTNPGLITAKKVSTFVTFTRLDLINRTHERSKRMKLIFLHIIVCAAMILFIGNAALG